MATFEDTAGKKFNTYQEAAQSNTSMGTNPSATVISANNLDKPKAFVLPEKTVIDNTSTFVLPEVTSPLQIEQNRLKAEKTSQEGEIQSLLKNIGIEQGKEATIATELGADKAQQEYDRLASDLEAEQLASRRQVESIQKNNTGGALRGGQLDLVSNIQRDSLSKQADIAILGNAAKGRFDTAMSIAKRKVESALLPLKAELDAKKFVYENNKDLFSKAELSKLDTLIKADDAKIKKEEDRLTKGNEMIINALQQKASPDMIQKAKDTLAKGGTLTEMTSVLGRFGMNEADRLDLELKRAQIDKINTENNILGGNLTTLDDTQYSKFTANPNYKAIQDGGKFYNALESFKVATDKWGTAERLNAKGRGELNSTYMSLVALTKDYYTLGTLDAGVEKLVSLGIPKPGTYSTRDKVVKSAIDTSKKQVLDSINNSANQLAKSPYGKSVQFQSLLTESLPKEELTQEEYDQKVLDTLAEENNPFSVYTNQSNP